jgi:hypothetical protein
MQDSQPLRRYILHIIRFEGKRKGKPREEENKT